MPRRLHQPNGASHIMNSNTGWSIGSNGLTRDGKAELLKQLGHRLQADYQNVLKEPTPERFRQLLEKLDQQYEISDEEDK